MEYLAAATQRFEASLTASQNEKLKKELRQLKIFQDACVLHGLSDQQKEFLESTISHGTVKPQTVSLDKLSDGGLIFSRHLISFQNLQRLELHLASLESPIKQDVINFSLHWCHRSVPPKDPADIDAEIKATISQADGWSQAVAIYSSCNFAKALNVTDNINRKIGYLTADIYRLKKTLPQ